MANLFNLTKGGVQIEERSISSRQDAIEAFLAIMRNALNPLNESAAWAVLRNKSFQDLARAYDENVLKENWKGVEANIKDIAKTVEDILVQHKLIRS